MLVRGLHALVLLFALSMCALQLPLLAATGMPDMVVTDSHVAVQMGHLASQPAAELCCALQAAPASQPMVPPVALAGFAVWLLAAWTPRPLKSGPDARHPTPLPGLRGRPFLHAYLN